MRTVLDRLDDTTHNQDDVFLALLRVVSKSHGLALEQEGLFYTHKSAAEGLDKVDENGNLSEELDLLASMFPEMGRSCSLVLVAPCCILDVALDGMDIRFVITQAQCYPAEKSRVYCWLMGASHSPAQCRQLSIDAMHQMQRLPRGQPVLFEAISYVQENMPTPEPIDTAPAGEAAVDKREKGKGNGHGKDAPAPATQAPPRPPPQKQQQQKQGGGGAGGAGSKPSAAGGAAVGVVRPGGSAGRKTPLPLPPAPQRVPGGTGACPNPGHKDKVKKGGDDGAGKAKAKAKAKSEPMEVKSTLELAQARAMASEKGAENPLDSQEYRDALFAALNDGLSGQMARDSARERLKDVLPASVIKEIAHEQRKREAKLHGAYSFAMAGMGTEINATKRVMAETALARGKCKGLLARAREIMEEEGRDAAKDEKALIELWAGECVSVLRKRNEKEKKKKEEYLANKAQGPPPRDAYEGAAASVSGGGGSKASAAGVTAGAAAKEKEKEKEKEEAAKQSASAFSVDVCADTAKEKARERAEETEKRGAGRGGRGGTSEREVERESAKLASELKSRHKNNSFLTILRKRENLPTYMMREELIAAVRASSVTVVSGETGCGKTTQLPQLVLDDAIANGEGGACRMIVTQPRRISAVSVAERIAFERCEKVGQSAGYHIRLEKKAGPNTRLLVMTTGILLRRMQLDESLTGISHVFVDEVHERDINTDFLLIVLKGLLSTRPDLKIVLMSATLNAQLFSNYFSDLGSGCMALSIPGRAFPVETLFLEDALEQTELVINSKSECCFKGSKNARDMDANAKRKEEKRRMDHLMQLGKDMQGKVTAATLSSLKCVDEAVINVELITALSQRLLNSSTEGAILVFVDGLASIRDVVQSLEAARLPNVRIYPLHSSLSSAEQSRVFNVMPKGQRKIVVSTNIAETSVTIEDVVYVIDSCRMKENRFDEELQMQVLEDVWIAQNNARQRRGRAGRVRSGICYHLVSSTTMNSLPKSGVPEMLRLNHEELILMILALGMGDPYHILSTALSPPETKSVTAALTYLDKIDAVYLDTSDGVGNWHSHITPLGFHLATIPVAPKIGKILLLGCMYKTIDPILTVAASLSAKNIFVTSFTDRERADEAKLAFISHDSDLLTTVEAFRQWQEVRAGAGGGPGKRVGRGSREEEQFCRDNWLSQSGLALIESMRQQYIDLLKDIGFLPVGVNLRSVVECDENRYGGSIELVKAVLAAGMSPNITKVGPNKLMGKTALQDCALGLRKKGNSMYVHPSSVNAQRCLKRPEGVHLMYMECVKTSKIYARDVTVVNPLILAIFGGRIAVNEKLKVITVDGWVVFKCDAQLASALYGLQQELQDSFTKRVIDPTADVEDRWDSLVALVNDVCKG